MMMMILTVIGVIVDVMYAIISIIGVDMANRYIIQLLTNWSTAMIQVIIHMIVHQYCKR